jgi:glutamate--cysteine ligase
VVPSGKKPLQVLQEDGVDYVEVRCLDLNPFSPLGIDETEIHFLSCFLVFCLLRQSPQTNCEEFQRIEDNLATVVRDGRKPGLTLVKDKVEVPLKEWASEILFDVKSIASLLDETSGASIYTSAVDEQMAKVNNPDLTPSARVLERMKTSKAPYFRFAMDQSLACKDYFEQKKLGMGVKYELEQIAKHSLFKRNAIEADDKIDFDTFLNNHNAG